MGSQTVRIEKISLEKDINIFWNNVYRDEKCLNDDAKWFKDLEKNMGTSKNNNDKILTKYHKKKSPRTDKIPNFWLDCNL